MRPDDRVPQSKCQTISVGARASVARTWGHHSGGISALFCGSAAKARQFIQAYRGDRSARTIIHAVLAANVCLIAVHVFLWLTKRFDFHASTLFRQDLLIDAEGGYPEMFNYLQIGALVWLMLHIFLRVRQPIYASLGIIFVIALADDALELHEQIGGYAESIGLPAPSFLGAQHFGELLHWLAMGALFIAVLVYGFVRSGGEDRKIGGVFVFWIFVLGFSAAVLDAAHEIFHRSFPGADLILGVAEDGGEMLTVALALSTALLLFRQLDDLRWPAAGLPR